MRKGNLNTQQPTKGDKGLSYRVVNYVKPKTFVPKEKRTDEDHLNEDSIKTIPYFTNRNDFALLLTRLIEVSPTHRVCIFSKADHVVGDGFTLEVGTANDIMITKTKKEIKPPKDKAILEASDWMKNVNEDEETLSDIVRKIAINYDAYGGVWVEEIRGKVDSKRFYHINVIDSPKCLFQSVKTGERIETVFISPDWTSEYVQKIKPEALQLNTWFKVKGTERRISYLKAYSPLRDIYGIPPAIASLLFHHLELEIPSHNLERFYTDFMPKVFMQFFAPDGMNDAKKKQFYDDLEKTYTRKGGKRRGLFAQIVESKKMEANIHDFSDQRTDGDFLGLTDKSEHVIFKSHQWHPLLAGVPTAAGLGNSTLIMNVFHLYNKATTQPRQRLFTARLINPIFNRAAEWLRTSFQEHSLRLSTSIPISFVGELNVNKMFSVNEGRAFLGQPKHEDEETGEGLIDNGKGAELTLTDPNADPKGKKSKKQSDIDKENEDVKEDKQP